MIEIRKRECPAILYKVQPHDAGNIRECSIPIVSVKYISLKAAPGMVGANQFVQCIPPLFVIARSASFKRGMSNHLPPEKTIQVVRLGWPRWTGDHAIGHVEIRKAVMIKVPSIA